MLFNGPRRVVAGNVLHMLFKQQDMDPVAIPLVRAVTTYQLLGCPVGVQPSSSHHTDFSHAFVSLIPEIARASHPS